MKRGQVRVDHPIVQKKIERGLKSNLRDGAVNSIASNLSLSYFAPAALALNASSFQMGILNAIINLVPSLVQIKSADLIAKFSRKKLTLIGILGKFFVVFPILLIVYLHWIGIPHMVPLLILLVGVHYACTSILHPAWFSWMGSLVPEEERGRYFSRRNRIVGGFGVGTMIVAALILDWVKGLGTGGDILGYTLLGFGLVFALSGVFRIWSWNIIRKVYEPRIKIRKKDMFTLKDFLRHCRDNSFGKFSLFSAALSFVVGISTPFWAVYMLRDLGMSYIWYVAISVSGILFQMVFLPLLGKFGDKFGNVKLMRMSSGVIAMVPFVWVASAFIVNPLTVKIYLFFVSGIVNGFGWAGHTLALNNYVYDAVDSRKRGFGLSYMNFLIGIGAFLGSLLGAGIALFTLSSVNILLVIFAISGVGRLIVGIFGSKHLHEVRNVKRFSSRFWTREFMPAKEFVHTVHQVGHLIESVQHFVGSEDEESFAEVSKV